MSKCQQWISAWICTVLFMFVLVAGIPVSAITQEALPVLGQKANFAFLDETGGVDAELSTSNILADDALNINDYIRGKGVNQGELRQEEKRMIAEKVTKRSPAWNKEIRYQYLLASRSIHMTYHAQLEKRKLGQKVAASAMHLVGTPYVWGGTTPSGFDCSGFAQYVYKKSGINVPRNSYEQFEVGQPVDKEQLQSGDLVFFSTYASGPSHLGIYVGEGKFVHALNRSTGVTTSNLETEYYKARFVGAKRVL